MVLWLDTETYSETPIKAGTFRYVESCSVMLITYAVGNGNIECVDITKGDSTDTFAELLRTADTVTAHNAMFDYNVIKKHFKACPPIEKWRCTMVQAMLHSLPGSLDSLCDIYKIGEDKAKIKDGKTLLNLFCKPRPIKQKLRRATHETHPNEWARFVEYAKNDISAMREIAGKLPTWNYVGGELALWHLDQKINGRGFAVDTELAQAALIAIDKEQDRLTREVQYHTGYDGNGGGVERATQRDKMLAYMLQEYGILIDDLRGATVDRLLADDNIPSGMKDLLRFRQQASTSSTSKYKSLINAVNSDNRLRGTLQFAGAGRTARWSGRTFQPQNLPRPQFKSKEIDEGIAAIKHNSVDLFYANPLSLISSAIRGCVVAPDGKKLVVADLSNIEGRVLAWLAGEEWKINAFYDYDNRMGNDLYILAYAKSFNIQVAKVTPDNRQVGKVLELALGYSGGAGAFITFSAAYGIDLDELAAKALPTMPNDVVLESQKFYYWLLDKNADTYGLSENTFVTCDSFKRLWREAHPNVVALWRNVEDYVRKSINNRGVTYEYRDLKFKASGAWLRIILPSGRSLCYPNPQINDNQISYMGVNQFNRKWQRIKTYSGKLVENITQAVARDILAANMPIIDSKGYEIVLSIHDELLTETPDDSGYNADELSALMAHNPTWADGLPLAAAGFECYRYRKG